MGKYLKDLFGTDVFEDTVEGNWGTRRAPTRQPESLYVWVVSQDGMTSGSGWRRDEFKRVWVSRWIS